MRVVGGRHRGRRLEAPAGSAVRPTSDRLRETVFNILAHRDWGDGAGAALEGATVLDVCCGSGALGLEALSRGAAAAGFLDRSEAALAATRRNLARLGEAGRAVVLRADAAAPPPARLAASLAFLDPPYGSGLAARALPALGRRGWLAAGCLCIVEQARDEAGTAPAGFTLLEARDHGETRLVFCRHDAPGAG